MCLHSRHKWQSVGHFVRRTDKYLNNAHKKFPSSVYRLEHAVSVVEVYLQDETTTLFKSRVDVF